MVDEHFSRALSQPSSFSLGSAKVARNAGSWRGEARWRAVGCVGRRDPRPGHLPPLRRPRVPGGQPLGTGCPGSGAASCLCLLVKKRKRNPRSVCTVLPTARAKRGGWQNPIAFTQTIYLTGAAAKQAAEGSSHCSFGECLPCRPSRGSFKSSVVVIKGGNKAKGKCGNHLASFPLLRTRLRMCLDLVLHVSPPWLFLEQRQGP